MDNRQQPLDLDALLDQAIADGRRSRALAQHHADTDVRLRQLRNSKNALVMLSLMTASSLLTQACTSIPDGRDIRSSAPHAQVLAEANQILLVR